MDSLLRIVSTTSWKLFLFGNFVIFFSHALCETGQQLSNNFLICRNFVCQPVSRVLINFNKLMTFWICSSGRLSLPRYKFERWNKLSVYSDWALIVSSPQSVFTPLIKIQLSSIQKAFGYWKHALFSFLKESFWDTVCKCVNQTKCFPLWVDFSIMRSHQKKQLHNSWLQISFVSRNCGTQNVQKQSSLPLHSNQIHCWLGHFIAQVLKWSPLVCVTHKWKLDFGVYAPPRRWNLG